MLKAVFVGLSSVNRNAEANSNNRDNPSSVSPPSSQANQPPIPVTTSATSSQPQPEHCLETLLRNIEGLLAIAAHNARQQQSQLHLQKEC
ncbi:hypothetical protein B4U80_08170 [Leptotrombidium deliense]|uniref:Uncharacterized protein n=1 Tax=Leptotrombidium deliense TaxID=299467 RepID=A0A443STI7_9ACAR|nr:hypothetical protein B4U80_08170 [Leptotrombidium deliense]